jgi:hypothetical protein
MKNPEATSPTDRHFDGDEVGYHAFCVANSNCMDAMVAAEQQGDDSGYELALDQWEQLYQLNPGAAEELRRQISLSETIE